MPNAITTVLNTLPSYAVILIVLAWIIGRAIPSFVQLFTEWLPTRRRLIQVQNTLAIIRAKAEALEIAKKYEIAGLETKSITSLRDDLQAMLAVRAPVIQPNQPPVFRPLNITLAITTATLTVLIILGALSGTAKFVWENILIVPLFGAFASALVGFFLIIKSVAEFSFQKGPKVGDYIFATFMGLCASWGGFILTAMVVQAVFWLSNHGVVFRLH